MSQSKFRHDFVDGFGSNMAPRLEKIICKILAQKLFENLYQKVVLKHNLRCFFMSLGLKTHFSTQFSTLVCYKYYKLCC